MPYCWYNWKISRLCVECSSKLYIAKYAILPGIDMKVIWQYTIAQSMVLSSVIIANMLLFIALSKPHVVIEKWFRSRFAFLSRYYHRRNMEKAYSPYKTLMARLTTAQSRIFCWGYAFTHDGKSHRKRKQKFLDSVFSSVGRRLLLFSTAFNWCLYFLRTGYS